MKLRGKDLNTNTITMISKSLGFRKYLVERKRDIVPNLVNLSAKYLAKIIQQLLNMLCVSLLINCFIKHLRLYINLSQLHLMITSFLVMLSLKYTTSLQNCIPARDNKNPSLRVHIL